MTVRPCVLIPTYNNERTVGQVVRQAAAQLPVIVVNDGSTDSTAEILAALAAELPEVTVLTHDRNRRKGRALGTGMDHASAAGFTHAITIDSDGQHLTEDIPVFLGAAEREPETLWVGHRDLKANGAGVGSRIGRAISNFWTWVETGVKLPDTQSGYRCYPLAGIQPLHIVGPGYEYEIEVLVKAAWTGVALDSVPIQVRYFRGEERVSHMHPILDFLRASWLNTKLCTLRSSFPLPYLAKRSLRRFQDLSARERLRQSYIELFVREPGTARRIAGSVALGLFMGIAPVWGFQIALTLVFAHLLGASKTIAVIASNISFPAMIPPILYGSLVLGRLATGDPRRVADCWTLELQRSDFWPWVLGSFLLAAVVAGIGGLVTLCVVHSFRRLRNRKKIA